MIAKTFKHLRQGTLPTVVRAKVLAKLGLERARHPRRRDFRSREDAVVFLSSTALRWAQERQKRKVMVIGDRDAYRARIADSIAGRGVEVELYSLDDLSHLEGDQETACIVCTYPDSRRTTTVAELLNREDNSSIPFVHMIIPAEEYGTLLRHDKYENAEFVSPILIDDIDVFQIYEDSLQLFERKERKCQIRDYMDLVQLLRFIIGSSVKGDIAEFGSFRGHSGYLIARLLKAMGSTKTLYMFDTFEDFPEEAAGVDKSWSGTHEVDFIQVKEKFRDLPNVRLVKGDFAETFKDIPIDELSLVYVDCDSYRGTKFVIEQIYPDVLTGGGIMIFEDYGHSPLLGVRLAVHEFFDNTKGCLKFFSQFSGFYIVHKT